MNAEQIKALLRWLLTVGPLGGVALKWGLSGPLVENLINVGMAFVVSGAALGSLILGLVRHKEANQVIAAAGIPGVKVAVNTMVAPAEVTAAARSAFVPNVVVGTVMPPQNQR